MYINKRWIVQSRLSANLKTIIYMLIMKMYFCIAQTTSPNAIINSHFVHYSSYRDWKLLSGKSANGYYET